VKGVSGLCTQASMECHNQCGQSANIELNSWCNFKTLFYIGLYSKLVTNECGSKSVVRNTNTI